MRVDAEGNITFDTKKLRSGPGRHATLTRSIFPRLGHRPIGEIKKSEIVRLLDKIEVGELKDCYGEPIKGGPVAADRALALIRIVMNWQAARDDDFRSAIVRGMARTKPKKRARKRILADDEIRDVWNALDSAEVPAAYPRFVKSLLLCATRRNESAHMNSNEIDGDTWTIPGERYKTGLDHVIPLSTQAKALIGSKPDGFVDNSWFVFSTRGGKKPFGGFSKAKKALDAEIAKIRAREQRPLMSRWTLHDLRRTARSLMSSVKVPSDHAERVLGHVIGGVRETYDRYEYNDEKRDALAALAAKVESILVPPADNVVAFRQAAAESA
jgi:integrase